MEKKQQRVYNESNENNDSNSSNEFNSDDENENLINNNLEFVIHNLLPEANPIVPSTC